MFPHDAVNAEKSKVHLANLMTSFLQTASNKFESTQKAQKNKKKKAHHHELNARNPTFS